MMKTEALMRLSGAAITTAALSFLSSPVQAAPNAQEARFLATLQLALNLTLAPAGGLPHGAPLVS